MALTDKLTAIADAIRSKTGTSESLTLDAMVTAIDGISAGITPTGDINITENGEFDVTEFAKAIVNVASGGDVQMVTGTVTPATQTSLLEIEHGLGKVPNFAIVFIYQTGVSIGHIASVWCFDKISKGGIRNANNLAYYGAGNDNDITKVYESEPYVYGIESATDTHFIAYSTSNMPFATDKYMWIAG